MKTPVIAVDIDDTIVESLDAIRQKANEYSGTNLSLEDYNTKGEYWGYYEKIWEQHGMADELDIMQICEDLHDNQSNIPLLPGAEFAVHELSKRFVIILITARDPKWESATTEWLKDQFGSIAPRVYFSQSHQDISRKNKGQICIELGAQWLIDDNVQHCITAMDEGVEAILYGEYGWQSNVPTELTKCKDWQSVLEYFDGKN